MRNVRLSCLFGVLCAASSLTASAAELSELVAGPVGKVVGDCKFTEGPAWHPGGYLLFSDIPNNRIIRVNADGSHSDWMTESGGTNGIVCDQAGRVYAAQGDLQRVSRLESGAGGHGQVAAVIADTFDGQPFNKPNDLALDAHGGVYFTDPNYRQQPLSQPVEGVYYVSGEGKVTRIVANLPRPNGILVSSDDKTLYVANINLRQIMAYPIVAPGQVSEGRVIFTGDEQLDGNGPDGMALDERGNIYATYKQLVVVSPQGQLIGRVEVPEKPANCTFGGEKQSTLFITARTSLYSLPMKVKGAALQARGPTGRALALAEPPAPEATDTGCADGDETVEVDFDGLKLSAPKSWQKQQPASNLRLGQFAIPAVEGDAEPSELAIFPPFGGTVQQNIDRWVAQFENEGRTAKSTQGECPQGKYVFVELSGTYKKPNGPPFLQQTKPAPGYKMLGVILTSKSGGNYFLKLTGPQKTVTANAEAFRKSFQADASQEKPYELGNE